MMWDPPTDKLVGLQADAQDGRSAMQVLLGVTGGIAAYKAPEVVRALRRRGHAVRCVLTPAAERLVSPLALAAVSDHAVATGMWETDSAGAMPHITLARWADALLIAPATADCLARLALGLGDDLLATLVLALEPRKPVWLAPAMNTVMWEKPVVQGHVATLAARGFRMIGPESGDLACGEQGIGAMAQPVTVAAALG
jgi:phosphopantothenoylcysteine decarboxylase/phosphopantothenate--cysteine ligase